MPIVREILSKVDQINEILQERAEQVTLQGNLVVGMDNVEDDYSRFDFYQILSEIKERFPGLRIQIISIGFAEGLSAMKQSEIDLCILLCKPDEKLESSFNVVPLVTENMLFVTSNQNSGILKELQNKVKLSAIQNDTWWTHVYINHMREQGYYFETEYVPNALSMQVTMRSKDFLSVMPESYCNYLNFPGVRTLPMTPPYQPKICAIWHKNNLNPAIQLLLNAFMENSKTR